MLDQEHGLYVLAARDIFSLLKQPQYQHLSAWIGFYEIYQGQLYDLLNDRKKLFAREDGKQNVVISGLKEFPIDNVDNLMQVFEFGSQARSTGKARVCLFHHWKRTELSNVGHLLLTIRKHRCQRRFIPLPCHSSSSAQAQKES